MPRTKKVAGAERKRMALPSQGPDSIHVAAEPYQGRKRVFQRIESEDPFFLLVEAVTDYAIYMLDAQGRVATWNAGAERSKGYSAAEVLGQHFSIFFLPEDVLAGLPARELAAAANEGRYAVDGWRRRKDGRRFWAQVTLTAIRGPEGELRGFAKVTRDMTQQKHLDESLSRQAADLEARVAERTRQLESTVAELLRKNELVESLALVATRDLKEKRVMLDEIHHRVKNNLQVVQSLLKMSVRSLPPGEARTVTMATSQRVFAMAKVHEHLYQTKDLGGIQACVYLRDLFAGISSSSALPSERVGIILDCDDVLLSLNHAIPFGLLVNELVSNSLKHGFTDGRKGTVTISVHQSAGSVCLACQDSGVGLPPNFDPTTSTSMGLKLAASLAHQLGGSLNFTSPGGCHVETQLTRLIRLGTRAEACDDCKLQPTCSELGS